MVRVVLIEDNEQDRRLLRRFLDKSIDIRCDIVEADRLHAGKGEILKAIEQPEDLIVILDLGLIDGTGMRLNAVSEIRAISEEFTLYVVTGTIAPIEAITAISMGADGVWEKPPEDTIVGLLQQAQAIRKRKLLDARQAARTMQEALAERDRQYVEAIGKLKPRTTVAWYKRPAVWKVIAITAATMLTAIAGLIAALRK